MIFYPHQEDLMTSSSVDKLEVLLEAAQRYKAAILDSLAKNVDGGLAESKVRATPREIDHAFNWDEMAKLMRELRDLPEGTQTARITKSDRLMKLAEIYEVLRAAKMPKLEAVRLALVNEASQLKGSSAA
jgi:hypothetical protein